MNFIQLDLKLKENAERINKLKLEMLNKDYRIICQRNRIDLYKRFNVLIANNDIARLRQLVNVKQLYMDLQSTIQCAFCCTALCHEKYPNLPLLLYVLGTDQLENLFGHTRTLTHALNCDFLELIERLQLAIQTHIIYQKHPEWKKQSRICSTTKDYSSLNSWTGTLSTNEINEDCIKSIWDNGYQEAFDYLLSNGYSRKELIIDNANINILNPLDQTRTSISNKEEEVEEEEIHHPVTYQDELELNISDHNINNNTASKFTNTIEHDGLVFHKSNIISNIIHCQSKLSSKRTTRVYGLKDDNFITNSSESDYSLEDDFIFITDILATILLNKTDNKLFISIFSIDKIEMDNEIKDKVLITSIGDCIFTGSILNFQSINNSCLIWDGTFIQQIKDVDGTLCCLVKADVEDFRCQIPLK